MFDLYHEGASTHRCPIEIAWLDAEVLGQDGHRGARGEDTVDVFLVQTRILHRATSGFSVQLKNGLVRGNVDLVRLADSHNGHPAPEVPQVGHVSSLPMDGGTPVLSCGASMSPTSQVWSVNGRILLATRMGFEPTISALTGQCVKPLHYRAVRNIIR